MSKLFYYDEIEDVEISYKNLFKDLSKENNYLLYCKTDSYYLVFKHIILSLILGEELILLDNDFSNEEINNLVGDYNLIYKSKSFKPVNINSFNDFHERVYFNKNNWKITLFTSGTTGLPKKISHNFDSISRFVKIGEKRKENIWGFAYNPTHMAGLQVFFQALLNKNTIVRLFEESRTNCLKLINQFKITNISATPTFYRLLLPPDVICTSLNYLTSGGEKFDSTTLKKIKYMFPNCSIRNVYASTEAGALFASKDEIFFIPSEISHLLKIVNDELYLHRSLVGESDNIKLVDDWYQTGDIIDVLPDNPNAFRFVSRKNDVINTGGYKVNPIEVEDTIRLCEGVIDVSVFGKKNSLLGSIVVCQVVRTDNSITEKKIRQFLNQKLQEFKIPRIISFTDSLKTTRSGKLSRNN